MNQKWSRVFEIVLALQQKPHYLRELESTVNVPHSTLVRVLKFLKGCSIVGSSKEGKIKRFYLRNTIEAKNFVFMAEKYKMIKFLERFPGVRALVEVLYEIPCKPVIIFGSYASFSSGEKSDIDLFIETEDEKVIEKVVAVDPRVRVKFGKFDPGSRLGKEIVSNHVIVKGVEKFYERLEKYS